MEVAAVIPAAGHSTRMGAPKALLVRDGETALARVVRFARAAGCDPVVVVLGRRAPAIRDAVPLDDAHVIVNPDPDAGRTGSVKRGLDAVDGRNVLLWPVDHPCVDAVTVRALLDAHVGGITVPAHAGRRGHPIVLDAAAADEARALADDAPLRDVVRRDPARVREVPVTDAGVRANLDTPEDAARWGWRAPAGH